MYVCCDSSQNICLEGTLPLGGKEAYQGAAHGRVPQALCSQRFKDQDQDQI
jgi:hypothetical protein